MKLYRTHNQPFRFSASSATRWLTKPSVVLQTDDGTLLYIDAEDKDLLLSKLTQQQRDELDDRT